MTTAPVHPVLEADGTLLIDNLPEDRRVLEHVVVRGALIVRPKRTLRALEELEVTIALPELVHPLRIHCTVVILQPERAVLKLDEDSVIRVESAQRGDAKLGPPVLNGSVIRFAQEADLARAEAALCQHGFVMALPNAPSMDASTVRLALGDIESEVALTARIMPHPSGSVAIQIAEAAACTPIVRELRQRLIAAMAARPADVPSTPQGDAPDLALTTNMASPPVDDDHTRLSADAIEPPPFDLARPPRASAESPSFIDDVAPSPTSGVAPHAPRVVPGDFPGVDDDFSVSSIDGSTRALAPEDSTRLVGRAASPMPSEESAPSPVIDDIAPVPQAASVPMSNYPDVDDDFMPPPTSPGLEERIASSAFAFESIGDDASEVEFMLTSEPMSPLPLAIATTAAPSSEPFFDGKTLHHVDVGLVESSASALLQHGAVFALGARPTRSPEARIRIACGDVVGNTEHDVMVLAGALDHVIIQPLHKDPFVAALRQFSASASVTSTVETTHAAKAEAPQPAAPDEGRTVGIEKHASDASPSTTLDTPPAQSVQTAPPRLVDAALRFDLKEDVAHHLAELRTYGALLALGRMRVGAEPRELSLEIAGTDVGTTPVKLAPMSEDAWVVMFTDAKAACALLEAGLARTNAQPSEPTSSEGGPDATTSTTPLGLSSSGHFKNPTSPDAVLALPVVEKPTAAELAEPSLPLLLRVLIGSGRSCHVLIEIDNAVHRFAIVNGGAIRAMTPLSTLGRALSGASGTYVVEALPARVTYKVKGSSKELLTEALRGLIARLSYDDLPRGFAAHDKESPLVAIEHARTIDAIAFTGTQLRLVKSLLDGQHSMADVLASPAGARAAWETLYLLGIFRALTWTTRTAASEKSNRSAAKSFLDEISKKNHFEVLGVHWSGSPKLIEPAYRALRDRWAPTSQLGRADPASAEQIMVRIDEAFAVIKNTSDRQKYRRDTIKVKWSQQIEVMTEHAKLAIYRKSFHEAQETLEGLLDFHASPDVDALVRQLAKVKNGGKVEET
jgi:hypothetical protein